MAKVLALGAAWTSYKHNDQYSLSFFFFVINKLTTRVVEVDNLAIILEHVDFFNTSNGLNLQALKGSRELTVITGRGLTAGLLDLTTGSTYYTLVYIHFIRVYLLFFTLATNTDLVLKLGEFISVHVELREMISIDVHERAQKGNVEKIEMNSF